MRQTRASSTRQQRARGLQAVRACTAYVISKPFVYK